jgi:hypothetical protein
VETVQYSTANGTAKSSIDYVSSAGSLTFAPGDTTQTITIPILDDGQANGDEVLSVTLSNPTGGATLASPSQASLTINDPLPAETIPTSLVVAANNITHSAEFFSIFITSAYSLYSYWTGRMMEQRGFLTDEGLEASFLGSAEYIQSHGGAGAGWVEGMYDDLLGRDADSGGLSYWTGVLANGGVTYYVALGFAASAEREKQRIGEDYQVYLGRALDSAGQTYWVNQFLNGARNEDVIAGFVGSPEYYQNPGKGQSNQGTEQSYCLDR